MVDASELAEIQADLVAAVCDKTCVIQRASATNDAWGSPAKGPYSTINTTVAGMKQPDSGLLANYEYKIGALNSWHIHLPYGTDVQEADRLIVENQTLFVHVVLSPHSIPGLQPVLAAEIK